MSAQSKRMIILAVASPDRVQWTPRWWADFSPLLANEFCWPPAGRSEWPLKRPCSCQKSWRAAVLNGSAWPGECTVLGLHRASATEIVWPRRGRTATSTIG
jgi:hypothetical protein